MYIIFCQLYYIAAESTTYPSTSSVQSDPHSPSPTSTLPRVGAIVSGLSGGILLIFLADIVLCCVYKAYMRRAQKD